ncbi:hypothetical protein GBA52_028742 [Prunus armeniaca]|nr:hypothetical protein GBA52_028742 [Prunus armeniaca]
MATSTRSPSRSWSSALFLFSRVRISFWRKKHTISYDIGSIAGRCSQNAPSVCSRWSFWFPPDVFVAQLSQVC